MKIRPELFRVDSRRPDNVIGRDTSAELHVSSVSNDRQDSHDTDAHDEPTDNITRTSAQVLRPVNIEEIEKRMQTCLRENRTSPYKLAELCGMFPGHEPESLRRVVSCEEQVEEKETDRIIFLTWIKIVQSYAANGEGNGWVIYSRQTVKKHRLGEA